MAVANTKIDFSRARNEQSNDSGSDKGPAETIWANVGREVVDPKTGETTFIGLPMGIAMATMKPARGNGWLAAQKNALWEQVMELLSELEPGEEAFAGEGLMIQFRRTAEADPEQEEAARENAPALSLIRR